MSRPMGRPSQPTELKLLRGNPGKRAISSRVRGEIPKTIPRAPDTLGAVGRHAWALYWKHGRPWLALTDIPILTQLCEAHDEAAAITAIIKAEGLTTLNEDTGRSFAHHLYNDLRGLRREIRELWSLCYMTPTDRGRANAQPETIDAVEAWAAR